MWVSTLRGRASYRTLSDIFSRRTAQWFDRSRGPHWLRKCFTTTVTKYSPEPALDAAVIGRTLAERLGATVVAEFSDKEQSGALSAAASGWTRS